MHAINGGQMTDGKKKNHRATFAGSGQVRGA
jgi:hypothetical protein